MSVYKAPDFEPMADWLNVSRPLSMADLAGKIVLLDFWTFCCINCMHVIPELDELERRYPDDLVVVGVHSAKFDNERETANIRNAVLRYGIRHPVVNDSDFVVWRKYGVRAWPTLVLIDPDGFIVGGVSGEGNGEILAGAIEKLKEDFQGKISRGPFPLIALESEKNRPDTAERQEEVCPVPDGGRLFDPRFPGKITAGPDGTIYIADTGNNRIVAADSAGQVLWVAGNGLPGRDDGPAGSARFNQPQGLTVADRFLYVADTENHLVRRVDIQSREVETIAGNGGRSIGRLRPGRGLMTALNSPWDVACNGGVLYIAMAGSHQIWGLELESGELRLAAGSGAENIIDGKRHSAELAQPSGLAVAGGHLYFADSEVSAVRRVPLGFDPSAEVETVFGEGLFEFGDKDGTRAEGARLQHPLGITADPVTGNVLYVADSYNHKIKKIVIGKAEPGSARITTLAGSGRAGLKDGVAEAVMFDEPGGLCVLGSTVFVADTNNHSIRKMDVSTGSADRFDIYYHG